MVGLALQGGGARGAYQIGAYYAFKKKRIHFDGVCGTSIGAFNGAFIASGKEKELLTFWSNVSVGEILGFDEKYVKQKLEHKLNLSSIKLSVVNFLHIVKSHGIEIEGLEKVLDEYLDEETLLNSKMDFGICTVRLKDFKPCYVFKQEMEKAKVKDYIFASCYLPFFKWKRKIDDHYYLDGGFYDNTPINMLIDKGYKKIYVIELNPLLNINRKIKKKDVELIRISPKRSLGGILIYDQETLRENIKMGYYDALRVIKKLDGYHYCFKKHSNFFYRFLTRKVNPKIKKRVKRFFNTRSDKQTVIKAMEYLMRRENIDYYQIYKPFKMLRNLKKMAKRNHFVYEFIRQIQFL